MGGQWVSSQGVLSQVLGALVLVQEVQSYDQVGQDLGQGGLQWPRASQEDPRV